MVRGAFRIIDIEPKVLDELQRKAPAFPAFWFQHAVSAYINARDNPSPVPKGIRDELNEISEQAIDLSARLSGCNQSVSDCLSASESTSGHKGLTKRIIADLRDLMGIAEMARRDAEKRAVSGRTISSRTDLIEDLAGALMEEGLPVTAKAQDSLVLAFGIALRAAGEEVADPARTVASALKTIKAKK